jgi:uncharacterized protein DUF4440
VRRRGELLAREKQYWEAIRSRDGATATRLSDARCLVIGPQGIGQLDRQALAGMVENAPYELKKFRFDDDVHVRAIADGVALIAYKVKEEMIVDGKPTALEAFDSSVWVWEEMRAGVRQQKRTDPKTWSVPVFLKN